VADAPVSVAGERPAVSVVLPVRDGAATIARAIGSIRGQTWENWELLVIDDGSSDDTRKMVDKAAGEDCRVKVIARAREGIVAALNAGLAAARGEFIARMDADDESIPYGSRSRWRFCARRRIAMWDS
jgi:glycosyltransferase involved in cell wall biosynthesis